MALKPYPYTTTPKEKEEHKEKMTEMVVHTLNMDGFKRKLNDHKYYAIKDKDSTKDQLLIYDPVTHETVTMTGEALRSYFDRPRDYEDFKRTNFRTVQLIYDPWDLVNGRTNIDPTGAMQIKNYNTYIPPSWKAQAFLHAIPLLPDPNNKVPELVERFLKHIVDGHEPSYEYLLDWMANSIQERNYTILVAIGEQGVGKGILGSILGGMHGLSNTAKVTDGVFKNKFNGQLEDRTLVYVDEIDIQTREQLDRVKTVVNDEMVFERKGMEAKTKKNHASFYFSSNHIDALKITKDDRRYSIIEMTKRPARDVFTAEELNKLATNATLHEKLALALLNRKIEEGWKLRPFTNSNTFEEVKDASVPDWERYVVEIWAVNNAGKEVEYKKIIEEMQDQLRSHRYPGRRKFEALAKKYPETLYIVKSGQWRVGSHLKSKSSAAISKLTEGNK